MGERKVLNKYFPPDFDPSKVPKGQRVRSEDKQMKVRMMLPMSVRCNTCGNFMYKGTKFNTRMEDVKGENYLGIKIFRFYYKCTNCGAEFCMKTDPKTTDYIVEAGATRNYEPWRDKEKAKEDEKSKRDEEEKGNAMKALENRTIDSKREMDILTALDEMKSLKARHEVVNLDLALAALKRANQEDEKTLEERLDEEDEREVERMLLQQAGLINRISDSSEDEVEQQGDQDGQEGSLMNSSKPNLDAGNGHAGQKRPLNGLSMAAEALEDEIEAAAGAEQAVQDNMAQQRMHNGRLISGQESEDREGANALRNKKVKGSAASKEHASVPSFGLSGIRKAIKPVKILKETLPNTGKYTPAETGNEALLGLAAYGSSDSE
eukprot:jgi/Picsp_1/5674/NSC_03033-R1_coiled-coil domain-containing protein 94 homolog